MNRKLIKADRTDFPEMFRELVTGASVYDSSCSPYARVLFIDKGEGFYLKKSEKGLLTVEDVMTRYFSSIGLTSGVVSFFQDDTYDWLLTRRVRGEDCTHKLYLSEPEKLCDLLAFKLRELHETDHSDCPVKSRMETYFETADKNYYGKCYDASYFLGNKSYGVDDIYKYAFSNKDALNGKVLLHGDYCLPNVILDNWRFSGFIDLGNGGVGDRHIDLYWGAWTLNFNLKTGKYRDRFFDAYGRDVIDLELIKLVSAFEVFG